jgi:hypothetical protein
MLERPDSITLPKTLGTATEAIAAADIAEVTNWRRESFLDLDMV